MLEPTGPSGCSTSPSVVTDRSAAVRSRLTAREEAGGEHGDHPLGLVSGPLDRHGHAQVGDGVQHVVGADVVAGDTGGHGGVEQRGKDGAAVTGRGRSLGHDLIVLRYVE
jgi:hypothetical protein